MSTPFSPDEIAAEGLKPDEYEDIVRRLGRHPNRAELGMFGVMWSEHCCYKNSRPLLSQFPTAGDRVLVGPGENAGVVDLGDGDRLVFKVESHNHPSAVEPFQGAATGVGGILRDIFTMGARPTAVLNSLRFGSLKDGRSRRLFSGVVAGISHYGNCVGVPTVGGEIYFDDAYSGNPLVNVMALGLMETPEIIKSGASGIGNPVLYVGSTTGRDGMGGASFASAELSDDSMDDRPAVQVGDPFLEKSLIEACLEAFKTGAVVAAQDMGAAGLTCSTAEIAEKGGVGIELDLDRIPVRESGMTPYEYLLSESQERMLFVAQAGREQELIDIFHRWELQAVVAGHIIQAPVVRILFQGAIAAEIPAKALSENTPIYHHEKLAQPPAYVKEAWTWHESQLPEAQVDGIELQGHRLSWTAVLLTLLNTPTLGSKRWVYRQYDHQVQNNTVVFPGDADAAIVRVRPQEAGDAQRASGPGEERGEIASGKGAAAREQKGVAATVDSEKGVAATVDSEKGVAATVDCNARYVYLNPYEGAKLAVAEAARNLSCVGAEPIAVTDNLNFGSPEKPVGYWQLAEACRGLSEACRAFRTPVTGGNVSLYNETLDPQGQPQAIYPTPVVGMVGLLPEISLARGLGWQQKGDVIYILGADLTVPIDTGGLTLGGSEYLAVLHSTVAGQPPKLNLARELAVQEACRMGISQGWVQSAHDCAEGGLAIALAECCLSGGRGADIRLTFDSGQLDRRWDVLLFGEGGAKIIVSVLASEAAGWEAYLSSQLGSDWSRLGTVGPESASLRLITSDGKLLIDASLEHMGDRWHSAIPQRMAQLSQASHAV